MTVTGEIMSADEWDQLDPDAQADTLIAELRGEPEAEWHAPGLERGPDTDMMHAITDTEMLLWDCRRQYPVTRRNAYLRHASDEDLAGYYSRHGADTPKDQRVRDQVLAEMQRRDVRQERRERAEERRRERWAANRQYRQSERERIFDDAEAATNGYMLNRRGQEAGVDPRSLFTGPETRARKYASEELLNYWEVNPRPTEAHFAGRDTRLGMAGYGPRHRMTSEEQEWRDRYDRAAADFEAAA